MPSIPGRLFLVSYEAVQIRGANGALKTIGAGGSCAVIVGLSDEATRSPELRAMERVQQIVLCDIPDRVFPRSRPRPLMRKLSRPLRPAPHDIVLAGLEVAAIGDSVAGEASPDETASYRRLPLFPHAAGPEVI